MGKVEQIRGKAEKSGTEHRQQQDGLFPKNENEISTLCRNSGIHTTSEIDDKHDFDLLPKQLVLDGMNGQRLAGIAGQGRRVSEKSINKRQMASLQDRCNR